MQGHISIPFYVHFLLICIGKKTVSYTVGCLQLGNSTGQKVCNCYNSSNRAKELQVGLVKSRLLV